jgi:hypothetical protein
MDRLEKVLSDIGVDVSSIPKASDFKVGNNILKDADTFTTPEGTAVRIRGINAAETSKVDSKRGAFEGSQPGADTQTAIVGNVARQGNFTTPVVTGEIDKFGRVMGDLTDPYGNKLSTKLLEMGVVNPSLTPTVDQTNAMYWGRLERQRRINEGKKTEADLLLDKLNEERNQFGVRAKVFTPDAKSFGASVDDAGRSDYFAGPAVIREGEDRFGKATSNLSTGLDIGMAQMKQGLFGAIDLIGRTTGIEFLENVGTSNVRALRSELESLPYLRNAEAFDDKGNWKLDSFGKLTDYLVGTAASSAPQMVASLAAAFAAPATFGLSLSVPAAIYTGNVWNEQKEKNASTAIMSGVTQAALDRLGLAGVVKAPGLNITSSATQELIKNQLIKKGFTKEAAEAMIVKATQESVKDVADAAKIVAARQQLGLANIGKAVAVGAATEGPTEGLQELVQYFGETSSLNVPEGEDYSKLKNRVLNATVGGALLGGTIGGAAATAKNLTFSDKTINRGNDVAFREQFGDKVPFAVDIANEALTTNADVSLDKLAEMETTKRSIEGIPAKIGSWWQDKGISSLWDKWSNTIMGDSIHKSKYTAALATLLGAGNPVNGSSITDQQALVEANIHKHFGTKEEMEAMFNGMDSKKISILLSNPKVLDVMEKLVRRKKAQFADNMDGVVGKYDLDKDLGEFAQYKNAIVEYANRIDNMITTYNAATKSQLRFDDFIEQRPLDKTIVSRYFNQFVNDLTSALGLSQQEATKLANTVLDNNSINSMEDALDDILNFDVASLKNKDELAKKLYDPVNRGKFHKYFSHDLVDNAYTLSARGAAKNINMNLIGKDGAKLAALIEAAKQNGDITEQQASFMAKEVKDFLDMRAGKFHQIENKYVRGALSTVNFLSTITSLPLAAISSTVEFAQVYRNLNKPQAIKATHVLLKTFGKEFAALFRELGAATTDKIKMKPVEHRIALSNAGYLREGGIAHRNDIMSGYFQKWTEGFFKITGLTSMTTITRNAKLAIAADAINNWLSTIKSGDPTDQAVIDAKEHLTRLGVDYNFMTNITKHSIDTEQRVMDNLQKGTYAFINEAVVIPSQLNRPKFYSDPYLRLFTQFQGYTSTFTANVLPRLIGDLNRKGSADQGNAAATIAMMLAMALLALYIKDLIKYGESPPEWLKDDKQFQRVVSQMGILGTGQRVWDAVSDITGNDKYSKTILGDVYEKISSQSPQLAYINRVNSALSAPEGKEIEKGARLLPVFGTSPAFAKYLQKTLGEE